MLIHFISSNAQWMGRTSSSEATVIQHSLPSRTLLQKVTIKFLSMNQTLCSTTKTMRTIFTLRCLTTSLSDSFTQTTSREELSALQATSFWFHGPRTSVTHAETFTTWNVLSKDRLWVSTQTFKLSDMKPGDATQPSNDWLDSQKQRLNCNSLFCSKKTLLSTSTLKTLCSTSLWIWQWRSYPSKYSDRRQICC